MPLVEPGAKPLDAPLSEAHGRARKIDPTLTEGPLVRVAGGRNQSEAEFIQALLLEWGVPSVLRRTAGFDVPVPEGGYFVVADAAPLGVSDAVPFCLELPETAGVVGVPASAFYDDAEAGRTLVRFAFCKRDDVLDEGIRRLGALRTG